MISVDINVEFFVYFSQRVLSGIVSSHIRVGRGGLHFIPCALRCQSSACRAVIDLSDNVHHVVKIQSSDIEFRAGLFRHDIRCFSAVSDDAVNSDIRCHMLPQAICAMEHQLCRIQRVDTVPRRCGRVCGLAVEGIKIRCQPVQRAVNQILVVKVNHHCHIVVIKDTFFD